MEKLVNTTMNSGKSGSKGASGALGNYEKQITSISEKIAKFQTDIQKAMQTGLNTSQMQTQLRDLQKLIDLYNRTSSSGMKDNTAKNILSSAEGLARSLKFFQQGKVAIDNMGKSLSGFEKQMSKLSKGGMDVTKLENGFKTIQQSYNALQSDLRNGKLEFGGPEAQSRMEALSQAIGILQNEFQRVGTAAGHGMRQTSAEIQGTQKNAEVLSRTVTGLWEALGSTASGRVARLGFATLAMQIRKAAREMLSSSVEIESALAQIQVVTGASGSQLDRFFEASAESAKDYGVEVKEMLGSVETFSRLGSTNIQSPYTAMYR